METFPACHKKQRGQTFENVTHPLGFWVFDQVRVREQEVDKTADNKSNSVQILTADLSRDTYATVHPEAWFYTH